MAYDDASVVDAATRWLGSAVEMHRAGHPLPALPGTLSEVTSVEALERLSNCRANVVQGLIAAGHDLTDCDRMWDVLVWQLAGASESDLRDALETLARTDALTGLLNRRGLTEVLERESARARRDGSTVSLVLLDLDRFKSVNDTHGHGGGDEALRAVADLLGQGLRTGDVAGRWGGDEFAVIFVGLDGRRAHEVVDRLRATVTHPSYRRTTALRLSFSAGVVALTGADVEPDRLMEMADVALYAAKAEGGNRARRHVGAGPGDGP